MPSCNKGATVRKLCRWLHRHLSFLFAGMVMVYALSGIFMNHRNTIDPSFVINRSTFRVDGPLPGKDSMTRERVLELLRPIGEEENFTQFYFPGPSEMKVFLKGGSSLVVDTGTGQAVYESVKPRPVIAQLVRLHFNPGSWWTWFADIFSVCLIIITLTGLIMVKGTKGLWGRGGVELLVGILIPVLFLCLH